MDTHKILGSKIRVGRKLLKMRQEDFAKPLGISRTALSNIEVGRHHIGVDLLMKICMQLKCTPNDLLPTVAGCSEGALKNLVYTEASIELPQPALNKADVKCSCGLPNTVPMLGYAVVKCNCGQSQTMINVCDMKCQLVGHYSIAQFKP